METILKEAINALEKRLELMADSGVAFINDSAPKVSAEDRLERARLSFEGCESCGTASLTISATGAPDSHLVIVASGEHGPLNDKENDLLKAIIEGAFKLDSKSVYTIELNECAAGAWSAEEGGPESGCARAVSLLIGAVRPAAVLVFGPEAASSLLGPDYEAGSLLKARGISLMPTLSLSDIGSDPERKRLAWGHIKAVMGLLKG